jgi:hypothetical protein
MRDNILVRLLAYYIVLFVLFGGVMHAFPDVPRYFAAERARSARSLDAEAPAKAGEAAPPEAFEIFTPDRTVPVVGSLVIAFLVALPITWVYRWTRPRKRYSQAFAHTLLVVPVAIALVVFLVKGSLALAFSLAGIVAAVRFRTALEDPMDAVYMFMVIGAGLAAGVQLLAVALVASLFFNAIALGVWRVNFGEDPATMSGWRIVRPEASNRPPDAGGMAQAAVAGAPGEPKSPFNAKLRVQTTHVEAAQRAAIPILDERAKNWQVAQVEQLEDGSSVVEFDVRLRKSTELASFIREIEESETAHISKVELKQLKAKKG